MEEPIHEFFELSHANYLVLPRSVLQSAPEEWQERFVACLGELYKMFGPTIEWPMRYEVYVFHDLVDDYVDDPLADYERGRRRVPMLGA